VELLEKKKEELRREKVRGGGFLVAMEMGLLMMMV